MSVSTPGELLDLLLRAHGMYQVDLSKRIGRPKKTVNELVKNKARITVETALQLEEIFGLPAEVWLAFVTTIEIRKAAER